MKKENGITMISLVVYVVVMAIVLVIMTSIINNFYNNTSTVKGNVEEVVSFNKFNNYFLKEVKSYNNEIDSISSDYILFATGNSFSIKDDVIYYNNIEICDGVESMQINLVESDIVNITINFENFNKSISYKVENIY